MKNSLLGSFLLCQIFLFWYVSCDDSATMQELKTSLGSATSLGWNDPNPCKWTGIQCSKDNRVIRIQIGGNGLTGTLPESLNSLTAVQVLEFMNNKLGGKLPSLSGLSSLQRLLLNGNGFTSIPSDFFDGMTSLQDVYLDNNPFSPWEIPAGIQSAATLQVFSAMNASIVGVIPSFFNSSTFSSLQNLHLSFNKLSGGLPSGFSGFGIQSLWLNGQKLNGTVGVLQNMTMLSDVWLHGNAFTGPLPDFSGLTQMQNLSLRDNQLTGPVPDSLLALESLKVVNLTNNLLQGKTPQFKPGVAVDLTIGTNSFCLSSPGEPCDPRVNQLIAVLGSMGYLSVFAQNWKGNDPCSSWLGVTCSSGNISVVNFQKMGLSGTISQNFSAITSLQKLILSNNNLTGTIPAQLINLSNLKELDVSNNQLYGPVPPFANGVVVNVAGNPDIGKAGPNPSQGTPSSGTPANAGNGGGKSSKGVLIGSVIGGVCALSLIGLLVFFVWKGKRKQWGKVQNSNTVVIHPRHSGSDYGGVKITVAGSSGIGGVASETYSHGSSDLSDIHRIEAGNMVISIQVLQNVTNNFSKDNILGKGGFGTVYKGELHDGTKIAVKRMESGIITEKGLDEFKSEIAVLTKVRHRHLVALLGYCLEGNERLLVFEYMPEGTLSRHLFNWKDEGLKPLDWSRRMIIALDVARGVEYLHGLAQQSFIHRDLKPSNILLGDDMRAKVADFGLVRLAPDGKATVITKLAGTFGYLAPEYAVTGRVTTKIDVYSFGVILMELITGRKTLDESQEEERVHLVPWFRRMKNNKDNFLKAIDPILDLDQEALESINTVADLACHCCAREPYQRPDMSHAVNVLSSIAELWKPSQPDPEDVYGIDLDMPLPQVVKKWQDLEGMSGIDGTFSGFASNDTSCASIPTPGPGIHDTFTSGVGR